MRPNDESQKHRKRIERGHSEVRPVEVGAKDRVVDPVCFMRVLSNNPYYMDFEGITYRFCSERCLREFRNDPEWFLPRNLGSLSEKIQAFENPVVSEIIFSTQHAERGIAHDLVCHMIVTPDSPHRIEHGGETHWFCTKRCQDKFIARPEGYLGKSKHKGKVHRRFR